MNSATPPRRITFSLTWTIRIAAAVLAASLLYGWVIFIAQSRDPAVAIATDWRNFERAGRLLLEGRTSEIYGPSFQTSLPFPYPPYFLYLCAPLGWIHSPWLGYAWCAITGTAALAGALWLLRRCFPGASANHTTAAFVVFSCAPWIGAIATGQQSGLYVLFVVCGLVAWSRGKMLLAGLWLSLLCLKPNLVFLFPVLALAAREWRVLFGFLLGFALLVASTLPLGAAIWPDYFDASTRMAQILGGDAIPRWKQQTLYAFWRYVFGSGSALHLAEITAAACALALGAPLLWLWRTKFRPQELPRLIAIAILFLVSCNPYLFFYDGLLLVIPAIVWFTGPNRYARTSTRRICGWCVAIAYAWQHVSSFILQDRGPPLLGPIVAVWLVIEMIDLWRAGLCIRSGGAAGSKPARTVPWSE